MCAFSRRGPKSTKIALAGSIAAIMSLHGNRRTESAKKPRTPHHAPRPPNLNVGNSGPHSPPCNSMLVEFVIAHRVGLQWFAVLPREPPLASDGEAACLAVRRRVLFSTLN